MVTKLTVPNNGREQTAARAGKLMEKELLALARHKGSHEHLALGVIVGYDALRGTKGALHE